MKETIKIKDYVLNQKITEMTVEGEETLFSLLERYRIKQGYPPGWEVWSIFFRNTARYFIADGMLERPAGEISRDILGLFSECLEICPKPWLRKFVPDIFQRRTPDDRPEDFYV